MKTGPGQELSFIYYLSDIQSLSTSIFQKIKKQTKHHICFKMLLNIASILYVVLLYRRVQKVTENTVICA